MLSVLITLVAIYTPVICSATIFKQNSAASVYAFCLVGLLIGILIFKYARSSEIRNYTEAGAKLVARCEGFKQFLSTAEKDRLEMLIADDPDYYYNILPYAHVLGVSEIWMEKTSDFNVKLPSWFSNEYDSSNSITLGMMNTLESISGMVKKGTSKLKTYFKKSDK